jgi:hypothetical protein
MIIAAIVDSFTKTFIKEIVAEKIFHKVDGLMSREHKFHVDMAEMVALSTI